MYSRAEKSNTKKEFWTSFGMYLKPIPNADGHSINWVNYKTGIRHIYFRMDADTKACSIAIEIKNPVAEERTENYNTFIALKQIFTGICGNDWNWIENTYDEYGAAVSKIYTEKHGVNIMKRESWPGIISFLKERIIKLDEFWSVAKVNFE